jgi:hypothetical protein
VTNATAAGVEVRALAPGERAAHEPAIAGWLVGDPGVELGRTWPQVFGRVADASSLGAFVDGQLRAHAAVRRVGLVGSRGHVHASLVGGVATDPEARSLRLASGLMHEIANREVVAGQDLILLWSDLWEFYARLGFALGGVQAEVELRPHAVTPGAPAAGQETVRRAQGDDFAAIAALHDQKPWRVERDLDEIARLLTTAATECFVLERPGGVVAYACHGKGLDFGTWWHELGGSDEDLAVLLAHASSRLGADSQTVLVPPYRDRLLPLLLPYAAAIRDGAVALVKPLTARGACELFVDGLDSI